jgi:carboxyl-terminal processing protease
LWTYLSARKGKTHPNYPLVVLINSYSASASEIVAGALADERHERAILVGERTHGKGSVQGISQLPEAGARLKYTMAYYHLPSGQRVESRDEMKKEGRNDWGVGPDIEVKLRNDEIRKMGQIQRDNNVLVQASRDKNSAALKKHTVEETLAADPQLAVGVLVIKSKLIQADSLVSSASKS